LLSAFIKHPANVNI